MARPGREIRIYDENGAAGEREPNKYLLLVSTRYMRAKYFTILLLVVYLISMFSVFREDITYAGLMYLVRDINSGDAAYTTGFSEAALDEQENMSYALYRGELAVIGNRSLKFYSNGGEAARTYTPGYSDPALASSERYIIAYDIGGTGYSIYNSIARVYNEDADGEIETVDINDAGEYLLVCRSDESKYVVCTYDSSFRPVAKYHKNSYVTDAAVGRNDVSVVIASVDSSEGILQCRIELYKERSESPDSVYTADGVFPVKCGMFEDGGYYVVCTDRVLFFGDGGELIKSSDSFAGYTSYAAGTDSLALSAPEGTLGAASDIFVFDTAGELLYNNTVTGNVHSLSLSGDSVYALSGGEIYMLPLDGVSAPLSVNVGDDCSVILYLQSSVIACRRNRAAGVVFSADPEPDEKEASDT